MAGSINEVANVKILFALALLVSFLIAPASAWWNSSWQNRYNVTLDLVNTSRRTTDIFWNFTARGVTAVNCTKEIRLTTDADVEIPSWSYSQESNGTNKNCVVAALVNQTSKTRSYWLYSNNTSAAVPTYTNPFTVSGGHGVGTLQGSIDNGGGMKLRWGSKLVGDTLTNAPSFLLEVNGVERFHTGGSEGSLFGLDPLIFGTAGLTCNITTSTPIFTNLGCWGITDYPGWKTAVIMYRNLPYVDMWIFNGTKTDTPYASNAGPGLGMNPSNIYGSYDYCASDDLTSETSHCATVNSQNPTNWGGWYVAGTSNMLLFFANNRHPTANTPIALSQNGLPNYVKYFGRGVWFNRHPIGAPVGGWFERLISWIGSGAIVSNTTGANSYASFENVTYNVPLQTSIEGFTPSGNSVPTINDVVTNLSVPFFGNANSHVIVNATDDQGITSLSLNWTWPNSTKTNFANLTQNDDVWTSQNFTIDQFGIYKINVTACDAQTACVSGQSYFSVSINYSTSVQDSPVEIGRPATIRLNYTHGANFTPLTSANTNLTIFYPNGTVHSNGNSMWFVFYLGLWQYNYTVPNGTNGTYKYNVKANVTGTTFGSNFDINGTFDTKDTTAPQISGLGVATSSCSGYSNYRFANSPFEVTFSATDNWQVNLSSSFCNFTMSNYTNVISQMANGNNCSFPSAGPAGSATVRILVNDIVNNTASASLGITVVDSCPVQPTPTPSTSSGGGSGGGGGGGGGGGSGGGGSTIAGSDSLPEIFFETRVLSLVQGQPEKFKIRLKNPRSEPLMVTLEGPAEVSFDEKSFTLLAGGEKEVSATFAYSVAGEYKPMISAQLGDLKRMYDLSVTVVKREADAVEQLLIDAQKAVNSLILLKYKACEGDVNAVKSKAIAIETLAGDVRSALLSKSTPPAAKIEELKRELSSISGFTDKIEECKPTVIIQQKSTATAAENGVQKPKKAGILMPAMIIMALLFGFGLFKFFRKV